VVAIAVQVKSVKHEAIDIKSFDLVRVDGQALPPFTAGAHIDIHLRDGLVRQYSLCSHPDELHRYRIAVKLEASSRGGSLAVHEDLVPGAVVTISEPRNNFVLVPDAEHTVLVAGGIGMTPLLSMAHALETRDASFEMLYFCRTSEHAAFRQELIDSEFGRRVTFYYDKDRAGVVATLEERLAAMPAQTHVYLCGPRPFMDTVGETAGHVLPAESIHLEYFAADQALLTAPGDRFAVELARSGMTLEVGPDETILDVLATAGVEVETSCEQGICGTCLTRVISGTPDHRDAFLTDAEKKAGDKIMICVSRCSSAVLVLDL
jgi:vanillate O-demethylase ferredoxin subunit